MQTRQITRHFCLLAMYWPDWVRCGALISKKRKIQALITSLAAYWNTFDEEVFTGGYYIFQLLENFGNMKWAKIQSFQPEINFSFFEGVKTVKFHPINKLRYHY